MNYTSIRSMNKPKFFAIPAFAHHMTLKKPIAALNLGLHSSFIAQLPANANVEVCGEGFNDRSLTVRWRNELFFVFQQDLDLSEPRYMETFAAARCRALAFE